MQPWTKEEMLQEILERSEMIQGRRMVNANVLADIFADPRFPKEHEKLMLEILNIAKKAKEENDKKTK